ncbi:DNA polymerase alpha subunit B [Punctularia strigosozonata HHB-11173 SS5]|uniref:DNA polymerase alpha subunit B n=1 Tax=Punctularia strigosozonata (strain HHB-11173) TaxID=741275 RepID=UPI000441818D|nr:DNA polymerase alpha subunit B [Punctularia strigosozonata HHB-11173 SS5]EIN12830.1 DNA polymerase alpha subunit B [Punctularia strigosozonata HHB-11173 SS5]
MSEDLRAQVIEVFGDRSALDDKLIEECIAMCKMFNLPPKELYFKWEAMNFNARARDSSLQTFTMDAAAQLKQQIQRDLQAEATKNRIAQGRASLTGRINRGRGTGLLNVGRRAAGPGGSPVKTEPASAVAGPSKVRYVGPDMDDASRKTRSYRYMYEKVLERGNVLDNKIDDFAELVQSQYNIAELGDPSDTSGETTVVGRIVLDFESGSTGGVKINEASLVLESSRLMGSGARVPLRFEPNVKIRGFVKGAGGAGLFPGALVALRGTNGGGGSFTVSEILANPPLPSSRKVSVKTEAGANDGFSMAVASGPFTSDADLKYKPWRTLLDALKLSKPAVVLLNGPFVDLSHPRIQDGDIDESPAQLFARVFVEPLREFLDSSPGSIALLVPSVRDMVSDHAVFPQAELSSHLSTDSRIRLLPNPCRFSINGVSFGTTSVDVLFHLRKEEFLKRCAEEVDPIGESGANDAMANLCRHLLHQRSFYPIFPVPFDMAHEVNLDVSHSALLEIKDSAPDVLIVPSRLKHFSKVLAEAGVTAVNPAFVSKGMYATLAVDGPAAATGPEGIKVNIVRLPQDDASTTK